MSRRAKALLIGIEKYDHLDADKQLRAGRNDVLAFWKVCRRLGFAPENIHVLTSPRPELEDFVWAEQELGAELPEYVGKSDGDIEEIVKKWFPLGDQSRVFVAEATRDNIVGENGLVWLAKHVAQPGEPPVDRLLTYSGHGTTIEENGGTTLALCPSDSEQDKSKTYISITDFKKALKDVDDNMTVVLDCCFAQSAQKRGGSSRVATLTPAGVEHSLALDTQDIQPRVFCAAGKNESSQQAMLGGYWYSAFTWALTVVLEQWHICREDNKPHSTITHDELLERTRKLLGALSFPQTPVLLGNAMGNKPVFGHLGANEETSAGPDGERKNGQMDPGNKQVRIYTFVDGNKRTVAQVVVPNVTGILNGMQYVAGWEYWLQVSTTLPATSLTISWTDHNWSDRDFPSVGAQSFKMNRNATWNKETYTCNPAAADRFVNNDNRLQIYWGLNYSGGKWSGGLEWYNANGENNTFKDLQSPVTLTNNTDYGDRAINTEKHFAWVNPE